MHAQRRFLFLYHTVIRFFFWRLFVRFCPIDRPCPVKGAGGDVSVRGRILPSSCIEAPAGFNPGSLLIHCRGEKDRLRVNGENKGQVGIVLPGNRTDRPPHGRKSTIAAAAAAAAAAFG
ncbi:DNA replication licensing factor [Trichinella pseudospiralis]